MYPVSSNSYVLYWTDVDISSVAAGTEVTVLKYGSGSGNYFTGKARVVEHTLDGETYKVLEYQPALIDQQIIEKP